MGTWSCSISPTRTNSPVCSFRMYKLPYGDGALATPGSTRDTGSICGLLSEDYYSLSLAPTECWQCHQCRVSWCWGGMGLQIPHVTACLPGTQSPVLITSILDFLTSSSCIPASTSLDHLTSFLSLPRLRLTSLLLPKSNSLGMDIVSGFMSWENSTWGNMQILRCMVMCGINL